MCQRLQGLAMGMERINKKLHIARRGVVYSLVLCTLILLIGGVGFWALDPGVNTLADGLWLAFTTAATVGYGDVVPSTHASRGFSVIVVLLGLAVLSLATASLAAIFVEKDVAQEEDLLAQDLLREINLLREDIRVLRDEVRHLRAPAPRH
jgi:voltage-gated potassium channel